MEITEVIKRCKIHTEKFKNCGDCRFYVIGFGCYFLKKYPDEWDISEINRRIGSDTMAYFLRKSTVSDSDRELIKRLKEEKASDLENLSARLRQLEEKVDSLNTDIQVWLNRMYPGIFTGENKKEE